MGEAKRFTRRHKPDIVLYFDRMDQPARVDMADLPLLKTITATFGAAGKTLNPQPSTLNPQPSTLNPQPSTLNP